MLSITAETAPVPVTVRAQIVNGCSVIGDDFNYGSVEAEAGYLEPLVWSGPKAIGGDVAGIMGSLPVPGWAGCLGKGRVVVWGGHDAFFTVRSDGKHDNDRFREQLFAWLCGKGRSSAFTTGHGEWLKSSSLSPALKKHLLFKGVKISDEPGEITPALLEKYDMLVVGNPWKDLKDREIGILHEWVKKGGSLLVVGLGWSWFSYNVDPGGNAYPVNRIGRVFGWNFKNGVIRDPESLSAGGRLLFKIRKAGEYRPLKLSIISLNEHPVNLKLKSEKSGGAIALAGEYTGLHLPGDKWKNLKDPFGALRMMDRFYTAQIELSGGGYRPYNGNRIWYMPADDPSGKYYMYSGNPVVYKAEAADELIKAFNDRGIPYWGMVHENGHNMVYNICRDIFVLSGGGTGECWANLFTVYAYEKNGWLNPPGINKNIFADGIAYNRNSEGGIDRLKKDNWIFLGCLNLIREKYGWDGMIKFFSKAAEDAAEGKKFTSDEEKMDYIAHMMSESYSLNLVPVFERWGFSVKNETRSAMKIYADAQLQ